MNVLSVLLQADYYSQGYNTSSGKPAWLSLLIIIVFLICFGVLLYLRIKAKKEGREFVLFPSLKLNKGYCALIGAVCGMVVEYMILAYLEGESLEFTTITFLLLLPGAIIGAVVGFAAGQDHSTESKTVSQTGTLQQDSATEIMNYKKLLDDGIITQEEFDKKKQEILERK